MVKEKLQDRFYEQIFAEKLGLVWDCELIKLQSFSKVDYAVIKNGKTTAFCELKERSFSSEKYDSTLIDLDKFMYLSQLSNLTKVFLCIRFPDCDKFIMINEPLEYTIAVKRMNGEHAPCALIPLNQFKTL